MLIYNVSIQVDKTIAMEWLQWMQEEHLDEVKSTGMFDSYSLLELLEPFDEVSKTYIAQYFTSSESRYNQYIEEYSATMRQKGIDKFGAQFIAFRTKLKKII